MGVICNKTDENIILKTWGNNTETDTICAVYRIYILQLFCISNWILSKCQWDPAGSIVSSCSVSPIQAH